MLKRAATYSVIVFCVVALWASTSRTAMHYVTSHRDVNKWWGSYQWLNGDLVSMSCLDFVKAFNPTKVPFIIKRPVYTGPRTTVLYLRGDSHTWHLDDSDFAGLYAFHYTERIHPGHYHLDTSKRNILVVEVSESYARSFLGSLQMMNEYTDTTANGTAFFPDHYSKSGTVKYASFSGLLDPNIFFNKYINQNLQCNLFNYQFMMPMFESKAALNYYLFNRASGDVVISNDRQFLFLKETVSRNDIGSSYATVPNEEIEHIVDDLNTINDNYRKKGFKEVYVSIIPNSATIMQPEGYNDLIPRIQNDPRLRMKMIDIYSVFKNSSELYFKPGDTHWNIKGLQRWIDLVNEQLVAG